MRDTRDLHDGQTITHRELLDRAREYSRRPPEMRRREARANYPAAYNSAANTPSLPTQGAALPVGRVFVEVRNAENAAGGGRFEVSVIAKGEGVRAHVASYDTTGAPSVLAGGSAVFWCWDEEVGAWGETGVAELLPLGSRVTTTDQLVTVGTR